MLLQVEQSIITLLSGYGEMAATLLIMFFILKWFIKNNDRQDLERKEMFKSVLESSKADNDKLINALNSNSDAMKAVASGMEAIADSIRLRNEKK